MWHIRPQHNPANHLCQPQPFVPHSSSSIPLFPFLSPPSFSMLFPAIYIVLTFQFPILIWVLGVTSGLFCSWASSRLWLKGVIRCLSKQGTALAPTESCLRVFKVSAIHFVLRGGGGGWLAHQLTPSLEDQGLFFVWPQSLDQSGMVRPARDYSPSRHTSQGHWGTQASPPQQGDSPRVRTKSHMLGRKSHNGTSKTKKLVPVHLDLPLFWKSHCAICVPARVTLYNVTGSYNGPILVSNL